ncbi:MAG: M20/M25/M40 family metallo-hydrolase [Proteobacteria bacterium]|nr:M20/M25/M40 family metallo-hydrolase [Pseudomonadota bacterium]MBU1389801.1 M20/M25/M40 family metallo-hydrolase [Pseudomonadota bacterium]MBU1543810.1 M20/M25/M40 family metallo-hydrolase [Pseudomonadota bacterium]MBU2482749.1 M20/M25/M40 family metallo-hydrolase [Pseudomonadota bacterium]
MIDSARLGQRFEELVKIDSLSGCERNVALELEKILTEMGAAVCFDSAADKVGGNCSNLVAKFKGTVDAEPIFLSGHMDTVGPGEGIKVRFADGIYKSDGTTVLGADDKSAIAIILEVMQVILDNHLEYPPVELIFTVCEEIGLLGAKHLDYSLIESKFGYILDSTDTRGIVTKAPAANKITIKIYGKAAHAGAAPEKGVNAILVTSKAISGLTLGRIDHETTCNLGTIKGGVATNIVPEFVEIQGEARSHDPEKLEAVTQGIVNAFYTAAEEFSPDSRTQSPRIEAVIETDFPHTHICEDHKVIKLARKAAANLGTSMESRTIGGGADANIFFSKGIVAGVLGTGMTDVHTLNESIALADMENCARLILEILKVHASGETY